jgi:hypothetical protein
VRFKMKKIMSLAAVIFWAALFVGGYAQTQAEDKSFQETKLLIFDEKWEEAQAKLEEFIKAYPQSPLYSQAVFYRAKCLGEQKGKEKEALKALQSFLELRDRNRSLIEEAETSIINLAFELCSRGERTYANEIVKRLDSSNRVVKYYAAYKLSFVEDKALASKSVSVLKQIIEDEKDQELKDRARIALLRVAPDALRDVEGAGLESEALVLKIRVYDEQTKREEVSINLPWALADLALSSIVEENREALIKKGYDLTKLRRDLTRTKGNIITISSEGKTIKIWIE